MIDVGADTVTTVHAPYLQWATTLNLPRRAALIVDDPVPLQQYFVTAKFPSGSVEAILLELFEDENWVASLRSDRSTFSDGDSPEDALNNLLLSVEEDLQILSEYGDNLTEYLKRKRHFLRSLLTDDSA